MRKYDDKKSDRYKSLRAYQQREYEEFKHAADGAPEIPTGTYSTVSDYIALMQHYSVPTAFLNFSENAFSALYFALEHYFEKNKNGQEDVALYLLKPSMLNTLSHQKIIDAEITSKPVEDCIFETFQWIKKHTTNPKKWVTDFIPNLSIKSNEDNFYSYLFGHLKFDQKYYNCKELPDYEILREAARDLCMPVSVWTSCLNLRIRKQSGCFVAFNLYTLPEIKKQKSGAENHAFDYISLEEIQRKKLKDCKLQAEDIFLYKLTIDKQCCEDIMKWLKGMGINRRYVYPELELVKDRFN